MTENELLLEDRIAKIRSTVEKYGEQNFYISYSGGKDSNVLSSLVDLALPGNKMPRVYANTGIEYKLILDFVKKEQAKEHSWELVILKPQTPIKPMLEAEGYPFKSKQHARWVYQYQKNGRTQSIENYTQSDKADKTLYRPCPQILRYQFDGSFGLKISDKCCFNLKEEPLAKWSKENNKPYSMVGLMREEGGRRMAAQCLAFKSNKLWHFQPLVVVTKEWEEWFIEKYGVEICDIYKPPFNLERTGCKGCPFALHLQEELDTLEQYFPNERKQCEIIWAPVYAEYRRLGYRLKPLSSECQVAISGQLRFDENMNITEET